MSEKLASKGDHISITDAEDTYCMQENSGDLGILYQQVGKLCMLPRT